MRVEATEVLAQDHSNRNPEDEPREPVLVGLTRTTKIGEVAHAALEFASDFLVDFNLPSMPKLQVGIVRGFEDTKKAFIEVVGVAHVIVDFSTRSNRTIHFDLAIPLYKGELQKPSIAYYNDKKYVISQEFIDGLIEKTESVRPIVEKPLTPNQRFHHEQLVETPLFGVPADPTEWSMLLTERY